MPGWYRFGGEAGNQMADSCVPVYHCNSVAPAWLNARHPSVAEGAVKRKVCFSRYRRCCFASTYITVRNCGGFYVYKLFSSPSCDIRYCGNGNGLPTSPPGKNTFVCLSLHKAKVNKNK